MIASVGERRNSLLNKVGRQPSLSGYRRFVRSPCGCASASPSPYFLAQNPQGIELLEVERCPETNLTCAPCSLPMRKLEFIWIIVP
jgi:hypothetical protein